MGTISLVIFGILLTCSEVAFAGRAYAAYGESTSWTRCYGCGRWKESSLTGGTRWGTECVERARRLFSGRQEWGRRKAMGGLGSA